MENLIQPKKCPFCGQDVMLTLGNSGDHPVDAVDTVVHRCSSDHDVLRYDRISKWQSRPIEDALNARVAALEAELAHSREMHSTLFENSVTKVVYDLLHKENQEYRNRLSFIHDIAFDHDGWVSAEKLGELVDEIYAATQGHYPKDEPVA